MFIGLHVKYLLFFQDFNESWIFSTGFQKILKTSNFMKILPGDAELFHEDGMTDGQPDRRDAANSRFSQFRERA
jgi:hypothetical protein